MDWRVPEQSVRCHVIPPIMSWATVVFHRDHSASTLLSVVTKVLPFSVYIKFNIRALSAVRNTMAGISWHYVLKFIITGEHTVATRLTSLFLTVVFHLGDAAVGKSSLLIRLTDQRFLANPDPTVRYHPPACLIERAPIKPSDACQLGVEFGSKLISIPEEDKIVKLQCERCHPCVPVACLPLLLPRWRHEIY